MTDTATERPSSYPNHPDALASSPPPAALPAQVSSASPPVPSVPSVPSVPPLQAATPEGDADLLAALLLVENVLVALATWEDADDSLVLPEPLAGQQALHGVRRLQDAFAQAAAGAVAPQAADLALLTRTAAALTAGLASGDDDICQAIALHEQASPDAAGDVGATLARFTSPGHDL